jgi:hypothetical protein
MFAPGKDTYDALPSASAAGPQCSEQVKYLPTMQALLLENGLLR